MARHKTMQTVLKNELKSSQAATQQKILFALGAFGECYSYVDNMLNTFPQEQQKALKSFIFEGYAYPDNLALEPVKARKEDFKTQVNYLRYQVHELAEQLQELQDEYNKQEQIQAFLKRK